MYSFNTTPRIIIRQCRDFCHVNPVGCDPLNVVCPTFWWSASTSISVKPGTHSTMRLIHLPSCFLATCPAQFHFMLAVFFTESAISVLVYIIKFGILSLSVNNSTECILSLDCRSLVHLSLICSIRVSCTGRCRNLQLFQIFCLDVIIFYSLTLERYECLFCLLLDFFSVFFFFV